MSDSELDTIISKVGLKKRAWEVMRTFYIGNGISMFRIDLMSGFDPDSNPIYNCTVFDVTYRHHAGHPPRPFFAKSIETALEDAAQYAARELGMRLQD